MPIKGNFRYDLTGRRFGRLIVQHRSDRKDHGRSFWACTCECSASVEVSQSDLLAGKSQSCGCLRVDARSRYSEGHLIDRGVRHEYDAWKSIRARTTDHTHEAFARYGGRGIRMCPRWLDGENGKPPFECFLEDVSKPPRKGHSLDRIHNDGHYEPGNVRWTTSKRQSLNRHNNVMLTVGQRTMPLGEWCDELNLSYSRTYQRIAKGWPTLQALGLEPRTGVIIGRPRGRKDSKPRQSRSNALQAPQRPL